MLPDNGLLFNLYEIRDLIVKFNGSFSLTVGTSACEDGIIAKILFCVD